jgi:phosphoadenosine phosphosulfate reductase
MDNHKLASDAVDLAPQQVLETAFGQHDRVAISFSGAEDVVLIDIACNIAEEVEVFCLDTGRLHPETYQFIEKVRDFYGIDIDVISPNGHSVATLVKEKGLFSFYRDGHTECCSIRKIEPLRSHLATVDAWVTGQRRDQSPTRSIVAQIQDDLAFSTTERRVKKYNPLANWSSTQVWQYIRDHDVPYNTLHDKGFRSIGCEPCTRSTAPNQHEREGRWWWEEATRRECGLHVVTEDQQTPPPAPV